MTRDWHREHLENRTSAQRLADSLARGVGSWAFIIGQTLVVLVWVALNVIGWTRHWDPYPFIFLNLVFSVLAAYTAPLVMMSQNRQDERDRARAEADYETNLESHAEIELLQQALTRIEEEHLARITSLIEELRDSVRTSAH